MGLRAIITALALLTGPVLAQEPWPLELIDPAADETPADLLLPMPCGAAMAFQKVNVPVDAGDPLADRRVRLGQSLDQTGYSDYLRPEFLRGPFGDTETGSTFYYIARYELTAGQYRALMGDCAAPTRADRLARGGLSWFDAVDLARIYSQWLYANTPDDMPRVDGIAGFVRLPTGPEWEYAVRGGARIDATKFPGLTFFGDGDLRKYALFQGAGGRGNLGAVGLRRPNPLGLYDVYGNAEELVLDPFRLNAVGRPGGQVGGVVTRGGSILSSEAGIYSAQRTEYPPYDAATGAPLRAPTVGVRLVLASHIATSDAVLRRLRARWQQMAGAPGTTPGEGFDPSASLAALIEAETDPRRAQALNDLQLDFRRARDRAQTALQQSARSTLLSGAVFVQTLNASNARISDKATNIRMLSDLSSKGPKSALFTRQVLAHVRQISTMRSQQSTLLLSYRATLETLSTDMPDSVRNVAYGVLREELALLGQADLLIALDRFWSDLERYRAKPDVDPETLLEIVLD
jgi:Sulfatase-modifying factor enzyme 1